MQAQQVWACMSEKESVPMPQACVPIARPHPQPCSINELYIFSYVLHALHMFGAPCALVPMHACPWVSVRRIRQSTHACITTIKCMVYPWFTQSPPLSSAIWVSVDALGKAPMPASQPLHAWCTQGSPTVSVPGPVGPELSYY